MRFFYLIVTLLTIFLTSCNKQTYSNKARYVILSPEIAEILYSLNVIDEIIGITEECSIYLTTDGKKVTDNFEIVGNFGQVNFEKIMELKPTIVFTSALEQNMITRKLEKVGIKTMQFYPKNIDEMFKMIEVLGEVCERTTEAFNLVSHLREDFEIFLELLEARTEKPSVYVEIYGNPIMTADNSSFLGSLIEMAGGNNIFPALARDYCRINAEDVVFLDPEIILLTYPGVSAEDVRQRMGWSNVRAVVNDRVFTVDDLNPDFILQAGPRNIAGIKRMITLFYEM